MVRQKVKDPRILLHMGADVVRVVARNSVVFFSWPLSPFQVEMVCQEMKNPRIDLQMSADVVRVVARKSVVSVELAGTVGHAEGE